MIEKLKATAALAEYCITKSAELPACDDLWRLTWIIGAAVLLVIAALVLGYALHRTLRAKRSLALWHEHLREQDEVAPELRMQYVSWKGDSQSLPQQNQAELAEQIREALRNRRINGS